jgi:serine/threonine protein kinase
MIIREYSTLSKLDHPLLCELLEVFIDKNFIYFVNPFYTGGEVYDLMYESSADEESDCSQIPEKTVKIIIYQVLKVMSYLKQNNILHRDLKPENIMFESCFDAKANDAIKSFIKIIDFGYSLDLGE